MDPFIYLPSSFENILGKWVPHPTTKGGLGTNCVAIPPAKRRWDQKLATYYVPTSTRTFKAPGEGLRVVGEGPRRRYPRGVPTGSYMV